MCKSFLDIHNIKGENSMKRCTHVFSLDYLPEIMTSFLNIISSYDTISRCSSPGNIAFLNDFHRLFDAYKCPIQFQAITIYNLYIAKLEQVNSKCLKVNSNSVWNFWTKELPYTNYLLNNNSLCRSIMLTAISEPNPAPLIFKPKPPYWFSSIHQAAL